MTKLSDRFQTIRLLRQHVYRRRNLNLKRLGVVKKKHAYVFSIHSLQINPLNHLFEHYIISTLDPSVHPFISWRIPARHWPHPSARHGFLQLPTYPACRSQSNHTSTHPPINPSVHPPTHASRLQPLPRGAKNGHSADLIMEPLQFDQPPPSFFQFLLIKAFLPSLFSTFSNGWIKVLPQRRGSHSASLHSIKTSDTF